MLSIGRLSLGQEAYYLDAVASGVEDYYLGSGEAPGVWIGAGAGGLGLGVDVTADELRTVLDGRDPHSGERRTRRATEGRTRVPGFDLTFSAPKSVSLLYGLGDAATRGSVVAAHEHAMTQALEYLERHATFTRRRVNGQLKKVSGDGLIVAAFRHRTSRAGDPQLHSHCLVANMVRSVDGQWGTLDSRSIYGHARTAGFVYQAVLRGELTHALGVRWSGVRNGYSEVQGFDRQVLREFSRRRQEIEAHLDDRGSSTPRTAQLAALHTRHTKDPSLDPASIHAEWQTRAHELGFDLDSRAGIIGSVSPGPEPVDPEGLVDALAAAAGICRHSASIDRRDVVRAISEALPSGCHVGLDDIEDLADQFLEHAEVVRLPHARPTPGGRRYTTLEMLESEQRLVLSALSRRDTGAGLVPAAMLQHLDDEAGGLTVEQADMIRSLCRSGHGVDVVVGKAGAGKTFALAAARVAWESAGHNVIGLALAARAAGELQAGSGIPSRTVAQFLTDTERSDHPRVDARSVLVVDEAAMVGTRKLAQVLDLAAEANAKVALVGDHHQLPEVEAGGAFRGLLDRLGGLELSENRRQVHSWERQTLDDLRHGNVADAIHRYQTEGRVMVTDQAAQTREAMVQDWYEARQGGRHVLMIAVQNRDVDDLNERARRLLVADGTVHDHELEVDARRFGRGDAVLCLHNNRRIGVINGLVGTVADVDPVGRTLEIRADDGSAILIPTEYLDAGHVSHAYATTVHKAQGVTADETLLLGNDRLYREAGYTGMSRGRERNRLYLVGDAHDEDVEPHRTGLEDGDAVGDVAKALSRSAAKELATDENSPLQQKRTDLGRAWAERDQLHAWFREHAPPAPTRSSDTDHPALPAATEKAQDPNPPCDAESTAEARQRWLDDHSADIDRYRRLNRRIRSLEQATGRAAALEAPAHLVEGLGPVPSDGPPRARWAEAAGSVESYRARWRLHTRGLLGAEPTDANQARHRRRAVEIVEATQQSHRPEAELESDVGFGL